MLNLNRPSRSRARSSGRGFSLVEIIVVIVLLGIVSGVAIASMTKSRQNEQRSAARTLAVAINYARERALTTGRSTWCYVYTNTERVDYYETVSGSVVAMTDAATNTQMTTVLSSSTSGPNFSEVAIGAFNGSTSASAQIFGFDWQGRPVNSGGTLLTTSQTITITATGQSTITLTIAAESGLLTTTW
jgi:prepilin-type N-terminal cleavage/methylation domain-containing protein